MTETLAYGYPSERTQRKLSNEYQPDRVKMDFRSLCVHMFWMKVALALVGFKQNPLLHILGNVDQTMNLGHYNYFSKYLLGNMDP